MVLSGEIDSRIFYGDKGAVFDSNSCGATFIQHAALAAFRSADGDVHYMVREFHVRRDAFCQALGCVPGCRSALPGGTVRRIEELSPDGRVEKYLVRRYRYTSRSATIDLFFGHPNEP